MGSLTLPAPTRLLTLDNGIPLSVYDGGEAEVSRLTVVVDGGSFEVRHPALLKLMTSMVKDGAEGMDAAALADLFDFNGAWIAHNSGHHFAQHQLFSLNNTFADVVPVFANMLATPTFPQHEFEVRRDKAAVQLEEELEQVSARASLRGNTMFYGPENPAYHVDTPQDIRNFTRDEVTALYARAFAPGSLHLFLSGRVTPRMEDVLNHAFSFNDLSGNGLGFKAVTTRPVPAGTIRKDEMPNTKQSALTAFIPLQIGRNHPDYVLLHVVVALLGGYFGSRLMANIRESKGLTYGIYAALEGVFDIARITVSTQCDAANVSQVIDEIKHEMQRLADPATYTPLELERVRSYLTTRLLATLDSPFNIQEYHLLPLTIGTPADYFEQRINAINNLTPDVAATIAARYIDPSALRVAVAGPLPA